MPVIEPGAGSQSPLAIGPALMVTVYAGGHISGGYYNPVVNLAVLLRKRIELGAAGVFVLAQVSGGITVGLVVIFVISIPYSTIGEGLSLLNPTSRDKVDISGEEVKLCLCTLR